MAAPDATAERSFDELKSQHRLLLLFGPYRENGSLQWQQQAAAANAGELAKRDVVMVTIIGDDEGYVDSVPMSREQIARFRDSLEVEADRFMLLLLDKGGRELLCSARPVKMHELLEKLDAAGDAAASAE